MILYCIQDGNTTLPTEQYCTVTSYDKMYRYAINGIFHDRAVLKGCTDL